MLNFTRNLIIAGLLSPVLANAAVISYSDFSDVSGLTINGDAAQVGSVLRVAPNLVTQAGTFYSTDAVPFDGSTGFSTSFAFNVTTDGGDPTDGFTFLLQNQSVTAVGEGGQGAGYVGLSPSVAVLFRGRGPAFVGVVVNGVDPLPDLPPGATAHTESDFYNQNEFAWIDYDAGSMLLSVYLSTTSTKPALADMSTTVDVAGTVGSQAFVGFSAGTGGAAGDTDISSWSFTTVPEPGAGMLFMTALPFFLGLRRHRASLRK